MTEELLAEAKRLLTAGEGNPPWRDPEPGDMIIGPIQNETAKGLYLLFDTIRREIIDLHNEWRRSCTNGRGYTLETDREYERRSLELHQKLKPVFSLLRGYLLAEIPLGYYGNRVLLRKDWLIVLTNTNQDDRIFNIIDPFEDGLRPDELPD